MSTEDLNPPPALLPGREIARQRLGAVLRDLRENSGVLLEDAAAKLGVAPSTLSRVETGKSPTRTAYLSLLLDYYQVTEPGQRRELADLARQGQRDGWWTDAADLLQHGEGRYLGLEEAAVRVRVLATRLIPGLLQEPSYAAAAIRAVRPGLNAADVGVLAALAARRRELLGRDGFWLHAIIDQATLIRPPATASAMAAQLKHLTGLAASENITLQVLPLTTPWPVAATPFALLAFADPGDPETACTLSHAGQHHLTTSRRHTRELASAFTKASRAALPADASAELIGRLALTD
jgi:transcriptional regulator with XRE-family HTH domain